MAEVPGDLGEDHPIAELGQQEGDQNAQRCLEHVPCLCVCVREGEGGREGELLSLFSV